MSVGYLYLILSDGAEVVTLEDEVCGFSATRTLLTVFFQIRYIWVSVVRAERRFT